MNKLEQLLCDLVSIDSTNPGINPHGPGEAEVASYIASWLKQAGVKVFLHENIPGRPNVVGVVPGTGGGKTLMLNGHTDTVGANGMPNPHTPLIRDGRLYGRGSYDMKGGLAACMVALAGAARLNLAGDVIFCAVMDEELSGQGTRDIANIYRADAAIIAEPTELELVVAHRGFVFLQVETIGVAAHGSRPHLGVDAILKMGKFLTALEALDLDLRAHPSHPLLGSGSLHASFIKGGQEPSTYPAECRLTLERRTIPGETPQVVQAEVQTILDQFSDQDPAFRAIVKMGDYQPPMETPPDAAILPVIQQAACQVLGRELTGSGVSYWTDAATLWGAGIPSLLFGSKGAGAHAAEEWVDLTSIQACAEVYLQTIQAFCG